MKKSVMALVLALALAGTLTACSSRDTNGGASGSAGGTSGSGAGASAGQVSRRHTTASARGRSYLEDGRYSAGGDGQVYSSNGSGLSRDLTRGAREIVRDTENAVEDMGRGIGAAARDLTGTPSWEPDSSAMR